MQGLQLRLRVELDIVHDRRKSDLKATNAKERVSLKCKPCLDGAQSDLL